MAANEQQLDNSSTDDEESFFQDIDQLSNFGINSADVKKLKSAGICTLKGFQMTTTKRLVAIKGLSEAKIEKIKEAIKKLSNETNEGSGVFMTANQVSQQRKHIFKISTGSEEFDKLLGGGMESMAITEAYGEYRSGKTQISHTLCITCQLPNGKYNGGKAVFIDTEHTFRPERLKAIASRFNLDESQALENVYYVRANTSEHQYEVMDAVAALFHQSGGQFKLLVIDSIMALFRVDYSGRGELSERQQKLAQLMSKIQKISEEYNVAVFITNQMTADPGAQMLGPQMKPIGGHILAHASTVRIYLRKGRGEMRIAKIADSPDLPESEANYTITDGGITDSKE